jgi:hypothetical protein
MLSGYVMEHAYDDRWDTMTVAKFFNRRLNGLNTLKFMNFIVIT